MLSSTFLYQGKRLNTMHVISIVYDKNSLKNAAKCLWHIVEIEMILK